MVIELSARELFFLGKALNAKYMDYAYIMMMQDIQMNFDVNENESLESLTEKGYAEMDFSGDIEVDPQVEELMKPVFFGEIECLIKKNDKQIRVHQIDDRMISSILNDDGNLVFNKISDPDLEEYLNGDVEIQCSNIKKGTYIKTYSSSELFKVYAFGDI